MWEGLNLGLGENFLVMVYRVYNERAIFLVREVRRWRGMNVPSRDRTEVSRGDWRRW